MRKAGIEFTVAFWEQYVNIEPKVLGVFVDLCMKSLKYYDGSLPSDDDELLTMVNTDRDTLAKAKAMFVESDKTLNIPDVLKYKTLGNEVRKPKHKRAEIDMSLYSTEQIASFNRFSSWIDDNAPRVAQMQKPFTIQEYLLLTAEGWTADSIVKVLTNMQNWKPLLQKNISAFLTAQKWLQNPSGEYKKNNKGSGAGPSTKTGQQVDIHNKVKEIINGTN